MKGSVRLLPLDAMREASECLKVLAHPMRLRIIEILMQGEFPVHEIARLCQLPPHQTCQHLRLLRGHGFLQSARNGRTVSYRIASPRLRAILRCLRETCPGRK
ncbi:MAG: metalloregulator ArsR/SmtB family transcription factor [Planctomycetota bacterium]